MPTNERNRVHVLPPNLIIGSDDADVIGPVIFGPEDDRDAETTNYDEKIYGNGGDDQICAQGGRDELFGGSGSDWLDGGSGNDKIYGDTYNLYYENGQLKKEYVPYYEQGNDSINAGEGHDYVEGDGGNDTIHGEEGNDKLKGEDGNDVVSGGAGNDWVAGGRGNDDVFGGTGNDKLYGQHGDDRLCAGAGDDFADGGAGRDLIHGDAGNDTLLGGAGVFDDSINGGTGNDSIDGGGGNDVLEGDDENDTVPGGNDTISGGAGNDYLEGGGGDEDLSGGTGSDTLRGGTGNDELDGSEPGGEDDDYAADYYVYDIKVENSGSDVISDFEEGYDKIVICSQDNKGPIFKIEVEDRDGDGIGDDALIWLGGNNYIDVLNAGSAFEDQGPTGRPLVLSALNAANFVFVDTHPQNDDRDNDGKYGETNGDDNDPNIELCMDLDVPDCPPDPVPVEFCRDDYMYPSA